MIMPGVEPGTECYNTYNKSQITGAYNLAFGFNLPLLYHEKLKTIEDLKSFGIPYNNKNFPDVISAIYNNPHHIEILKEKIKSEPKFQFKYQSVNYQKFVLDQAQ
jgi:hypothetical protein